MHDFMDSAHGETIEVPEVIPIFPLPETVLLPGELLPLHIFEDRYRAMVRDAIAAGRVIGMVELEAGFEDEYLGSPPIAEVGCLGVIGQHQELEDGRFLIWLFGVERFTVTKELDVPTAYRQAKVIYNAVDPLAGEGARIAPMRRELIEFLPSVVDFDDEIRNEIATQLDEVEDSQLVALACKILEVSSDRKRRLLEAGSAEERFRLICEDLYARLEQNPELIEMPGLVN